MKIAISGYGKMGRIVEGMARDRNHTIVSTIDPAAKDATHKEICPEAVKDADVIIEFSVPSVVVENIKKAVENKTSMVMATTAWGDKVPQVKKIVQDKIGFIFAANFSLGVNLFSVLLEKAAQIFDPFKEYDVFGYEFHHNRKLDSPSGTALTLAQKIIDNFSRKDKIMTDKINRKIKPGEMHLVSARGGDIPGTHSFVFDSNFDSIEVKHTARTRNGFALGALIAAEWLNDKKGFFSVEDWIKDQFIDL